MQAAAAMLQFSAPTQQNTQNINPLDPSNDVIFVVSYNSDSSHLMIDDPDRWAPEYARAGAYSVTFHIEAARDGAKLCSDLRSHGARAGVAVKPGSNLDEIAALGDSVDMILVMTVEPGFGGQAFLDDMLPKIRRARELASRSDGDVWVQVDGGIGAETIERCAEAGANVFVAGSAVFRSDDPRATIEKLRAVAERRQA